MLPGKLIVKFLRTFPEFAGSKVQGGVAMCTLIVLHRCVEGLGTVIAGNRDEYLDRPAEGPALRRTPSGPIVAPLDLRAGGTWFGMNAHRVIVAVTNRPTKAPDPERRSRGHVVIDALAATSAVDAARILGSLPEGIHNPFNAFAADGDRAFSMVYEERSEIRELERGAHVIGNVDPDDRSNDKIAHVLDRATGAAGKPFSEAVRGLRGLCREHRQGAVDGPLGSPCVHLDGYGTRSSFVVTLDPGPDHEADQLLYAKGAPCETEHQDFTALLSELTPRAGYGAGELYARTGT